MAVETDDQAMEDYLEGKEISIETLKKCIRKGTIDFKFVPVLCGSAFKNKGVQPLLDAVVDYLPSPLDIPAVEGIDPRNEESVERHADDSEPLSALVFKIVADPYVGRLSYFRVYSGKIVKGGSVYNPVKRKRERIGRLIRMYADRREEVDEIGAGDIGADRNGCVGAVLHSAWQAPILG